MSLSYEEIAEYLEWDEIILAGVSQRFDDKAEQFRAILAASEELGRTHLKGVASYLRRHLQETYREECMAAGVCPDCGGEVSLKEESQRHPYGEGTAKETLRFYICENCGEVG